MTTLTFNHPIPLSLYIHLPWCVKKCPYCDFNSHFLREAIPEAAYIDALIRDLKSDLADVDNRPLISIFIGGGTPSLFSSDAIARLLTEVKNLIPLNPDCEITLEANPGTVEQERFYGYREAGVNRLSIGIQSFNPEHLTRLGRIHNGDEALQAVAIARQANFNNINLDLMYGLPQQTISEALADLTTALSLNPTHLSWYQLTLEPNTPFYHKPPPLPNDDYLWDMQQQGQSLLRAHGFNQYEVSAYTHSDYFSRHNLNYWQFGDYLGIGAGAHSKITDVRQKTVTRCWKVKHPKEYLQKEHDFAGNRHQVKARDLPFEFMLNALRLNGEINNSLFCERTGLELNAIIPVLTIAASKQLMHWDDKKFALTSLGKNFMNEVVELFMGE